MKLTKERLKSLIKEEMGIIPEETEMFAEQEENVDATIDKAREAMKQEAATMLSKIEAATQNTVTSPEMLKSLFIQYLNET